MPRELIGAFQLFPSCLCRLVTRPVCVRVVFCCRASASEAGRFLSRFDKTPRPDLASVVFAASLRRLRASLALRGKT